MISTSVLKDRYRDLQDNDNENPPCRIQTKYSTCSSQAEDALVK